MTTTTMLRGIVISTADYKGGSMNNIIIVDRLIDEDLELLLSPFYRDSVGTEELHEDTQ